MSESQLVRPRSSSAAAQNQAETETSRNRNLLFFPAVALRQISPLLYRAHKPQRKHKPFASRMEVTIFEKPVNDKDTKTVLLSSRDPSIGRWFLEDNQNGLERISSTLHA
ncbi:hypothetical protein GRJ2_002441200 [Grus japonensis]|uniref:Uncharacterized protein n=1 Tax=Grus japonensis TaxID=30415 RepID=A0ABC9XPV8_GRUJA